MKNFVKDTVGHFTVLIDHATREYEPSPEHILKRMILPLCHDFATVLRKGTKNDARQVIEGFSRACQDLL